MNRICVKIVGLMVILSSFLFNSFAQISNVPGLNNEVIRTKKYADVEGSPYLYSEWKAGVITDENGKVYNNVLVKYDAFKDVIEINQDGTTMVLNSSIYKNFSISFADPVSNKIVKHTFRSGLISTASNGFDSNSYFEVLSEGKTVLVKKYVIKFIDEVVNSYGTAAQIKKFQRSEKYFLVHNNQVSEIKINTKSVLSALGDQPEIKNFIQKEKFKIKNEKDLITLIEYYQKLP